MHLQRSVCAQKIKEAINVKKISNLSGKEFYIANWSHVGSSNKLRGP
jgi:hypothetical protein